MSFRSAELAIQPKTKSRLRMVLKLYPQQETIKELDWTVERHITADELGDRIINQVIEEKYPLVLEFEREISRVEREMVAKGKIAT